MSMLEDTLAYLRDNDISFMHSVHPPAWTARDVAAAEHLPARKVAKTVVYYGDTGYGMVVVPADCVVDFGEVRRLMGLNRVRLADEDELIELFPDSEIGAMPPLGTLLGLPVLVDDDVASAEYITFNAGTHRDVVRMSFEDFRVLVNPLVASFALREEMLLPV